MEESAADMMINASGSAIAPMPMEAWALLALMLGLVVWGLWAERRD